MTTERKYISKTDFYKEPEFIKINKHIDTCLILLERLIYYNNDCRKTVATQLDIDSHIIDYRCDQFRYYENILKGIYYSCYSLKFVYDTSTFMNFKGIENRIGETIENQRRYITFSAIVNLSGIFEYTRKVYEKNISSPYFENLKKEYSDKADSLELLRNFRNTI